eukprot:CAMPEP_0169433834 /NCGR_PEP_ID=MMETSP1042-20121227/4211_1 /TAXON_ID=464988 /ORGANISM="Hemiselmis andersenii, Strain CCMP1180" /LENGTH=48 /DNA_ID= /DNA_START= /DNA_END= /DNA_ORIENTATION=
MMPNPGTLSLSSSLILSRASLALATSSAFILPRAEWQSAHTSSASLVS